MPQNGVLPILVWLLAVSVSPADLLLLLPPMAGVFLTRMVVSAAVVKAAEVVVKAAVVVSAAVVKAAVVVVKAAVVVSAAVVVVKAAVVVVNAVVVKQMI